LYLYTGSCSTPKENDAAHLLDTADDPTDLFDNDVDAVLELVLPQPGPFTVEEIFRFCLGVVRTTLSSPHAGLFVGNLKRRIELHTSYSGTGAEATALYWITIAARMLGLDADICNISFESACDTSPLCRRLLAAFEPLSLRPKVINKNILDKHSITVRKELSKIAFSSRGADLPKIVDNVSKMNEMLSKHSIGKVRNLAAPSSTYESELDLTNPWATTAMHHLPILFPAPASTLQSAVTPRP
jgi:hypothetical protein